jgi:hypothetical protein
MRLRATALSLCLAACAIPSLARNGPPRVVSLRATVVDSLTLTPLRGARVTLTSPGADTVRGITDTSGVLSVSIMSGAWRAHLAHGRFDSLRIPYPVRSIVVPARENAAITIWTPSARTVTRMLCGDSARSDDVAIVGLVRDVATNRGIDSAAVTVKWINLALKRGGFARSTVTRVTHTSRDGWYVGCGIPAIGTMLAWAERVGATSGAVPLTLEGSPVRVDFNLDRTAHPAGGSIDLETDSSGVSLFPTAKGRLRYRVVVRDPAGRPVPNARVRIFGQRTVRTNAAGAVTLDSVAGGTQTLEVMAIGYQPERRTVDISPGREPVDTFVLASLAAMLDTIRVTAGRRPKDFEGRRRVGDGQFITAADIARLDPAKTSQLFKSRDGLRFAYDRNGFPYIEVTTQSTPCKPLILVDGFPASPVPTSPGDVAMDWLLHPDEIGGVEIYTNSAKIPPELARWGRACATIAFWTREAIGPPR